MSIWDLCNLASDELALASTVCDPPSRAISSSIEAKTHAELNDLQDKCNSFDCLGSQYVSESSVDVFHKLLVASEIDCRKFRQELDSILITLGEVSLEFDDVTGRTNNLMLNCEALLEQQHNLDQTISKLRAALKPFEEVESIARMLGIPLDTKGSALGSSQLAANGSGVGVSSSTAAGNRVGGNIVTDPRSPEFKDLLVRLSAAHRFLDEHREYMDSDKYHRWAVQLRGRVGSIVARAMRSILDVAARQAIESVSDSSSRFTPMSALATKMLIDDAPIEGASLYRKFRGLGFRLKELAGLLHRGEEMKRASDEDATEGGPSQEDSAAMDEVKQAYISIRQQLLVPFVHSLGIARPIDAKREKGVLSLPASVTQGNLPLRTQLTLPGRDSVLTLCPAIQHAFAVLIQVSLLEYQLFPALFATGDEAGDETSTLAMTRVDPLMTPPATPVTKGQSNNTTSAVSVGVSAAVVGKSLAIVPAEILSIVGTLCNTICDGLRPLIIHENDVDELCRAAGTLADDIRSQIASMRAPIALQRQLEQGMNRVICDTQERLSHCAELRLRQEVQLFKPTPGQVAYPAVLEKSVTAEMANTSDASNTSAQPVEPGISDADREFDVSATWYPPLRQTLALLSKLYGVVEPTVFEDFARRAVHQCILCLRQGAELIARQQSVLHGDLFLVRHLLILREQLLPFDARLQSVERSLNFSSTGQALTHFASNARSVLRFDNLNSLWQLAREGLPTLQEEQVDAKRELDAVLKAACQSLKTNAVRTLLASRLHSWLAKVSACIGDIPIAHDSAAPDAKALSAASAPARLVLSGPAPPVLPSDHVALLRNQAFMRPAHVQEVLLEAQQTATIHITELKTIMKLYVDNAVARAILLKPVQQEVESVRRQVETVLASCIDAGQVRRDMEAIIAGVATTVESNLLT